MKRFFNSGFKSEEAWQPQAGGVKSPEPVPLSEEQKMLQLLSQTIHGGNRTWKAPNAARDVAPNDYVYPLFSSAYQEQENSLKNTIQKLNDEARERLAYLIEKDGYYYLAIRKGVLDRQNDVPDFLSRANLREARHELMEIEKTVDAAAREKKGEVDTILKEVLRCHGYEKNGIAISLSTPEGVHHLLTKREPHLVDRLPKTAKDCVETLAKDYEFYADYSARIMARKGGDLRFKELSTEEMVDYLSLLEKITQILTPATIQAVIVDSGLFTDKDFTTGRISITHGSVVKIHDASAVTPEQMKAASKYVYDRQPVRQDSSNASRVGKLVDDVFANTQLEQDRDAALQAIKKTLGANIDQQISYKDTDELKETILSAINATYPPAPNKFSAFMNAVKTPEIGLPDNNPLVLHQSCQKDGTWKPAGLRDVQTTAIESRSGGRN